MEAYVLDIGNRTKGSLLQNKTFVSLDGPIFSATNSHRNKPVSFVRAAWNAAGTQIAAGDCRGNLYLLHLGKGYFSLIARLRLCSSFITFTGSRLHSILVAQADCSIVSVNFESKSVKNSFSHHSSSVFCISFKGSTVLSCCKSRAILWDLNSFNVLRILTLKTDVDIVKVFFLSDKDIIVSAFNDDSVFLWDFKKFNCISQFLCKSGTSYLNVKAVAASRDDRLLVCAGKANWFVLWSVEEDRRLKTASLPEAVSSVRQLTFLPNFKEEQILSVLTSDGEAWIYNLKSVEVVAKVSSKKGKLVSCVGSMNLFQVLAISFQGSVELYDIEEALTPREVKSVVVSSEKSKDERAITKQAVAKKEFKATFDIDKKRLVSIIKNYEEFPEKHRTFIWAQLLELPHNVEAYAALHQESLRAEPFSKDCSFMNPGVQATFKRLMSLLICWHPVLKEIDYFQCVVFPFVKVLHRNAIVCFELLITLISNWCHGWFFFCPFAPFHVLAAVENILTHHDRQLVAHFLMHNISYEIYAWQLLKTSFSEVFCRSEWLKLWDHIFCGPLPFQLYVVAAFSIVLRDALLLCTTKKEFKECYRKHSISASALLRTAYHLQQTSPDNIRPDSVVGTFHCLPRGTYCTLFEMSQIKIHMETATRKRIIDEEIDYLKLREDQLAIKSKYLKELQELQIMRRKLLLESMNLQDSEATVALEKKLKSIQSLIQGNLSDQAGMLKGNCGNNAFPNDKEVFKKEHFNFQDFVIKQRHQKH